MIGGQENLPESKPESLSFIARLLLGIKFEDDLSKDEDPHFSDNDIALLSKGILAKMSLQYILLQMSQYYAKLEKENKEAKKEFLQNAQRLLKALILADTRQEAFQELSDYLAKEKVLDSEAKMPEVVVQYRVLMDLATQEKDNELSDLWSRLDSNIKSTLAQVKEENTHIQERLSELRAVNPSVDINQVVNQDLSKSQSDEFIIKNAKVLADDLKKYGLIQLMRLRPGDFYDEDWVKNKKGRKENIIRELMAHADNFTFRAINDIVNAKSTLHQKQIYAFYTQVLANSIENHDYQTMMSLVIALNHSTIARLSHLQNSQQKEIIDKATSIMSPEKSSKNYRAELVANADKAIMPYIGLFCTDVIMIGEKPWELTKEIAGKTVKKPNVKQYEILSNALHKIDMMCAKACEADITPVSINLAEYLSEVDKNDKTIHEKSVAFRPREPIAIGEVKRVEDLVTLFADGKLPKHLRVQVKAKVFENEQAYEQLSKVVLKISSKTKKTNQDELNKIIDALRTQVLENELYQGNIQSNLEKATLQLLGKKTTFWQKIAARFRRSSEKKSPKDAKKNVAKLEEPQTLPAEVAQNAESLAIATKEEVALLEVVPPVSAPQVHPSPEISPKTPVSETALVESTEQAQTLTQLVQAIEEERTNDVPTVSVPLTFSEHVQDQLGKLNERLKSQTPLESKRFTIDRFFDYAQKTLLERPEDKTIDQLKDAIPDSFDTTAKDDLKAALELLRTNLPKPIVKTTPLEKSRTATVEVALSRERLLAGKSVQDRIFAQFVQMGGEQTMREEIVLAFMTNKDPNSFSALIESLTNEANATTDPSEYKRKLSIVTGYVRDTLKMHADPNIIDGLIDALPSEIEKLPSGKKFAQLLHSLKQDLTVAQSTQKKREKPTK